VCNKWQVNKNMQLHNKKQIATCFYERLVILYSNTRPLPSTSYLPSKSSQSPFTAQWPYQIQGLSINNNNKKCHIPCFTNMMCEQIITLRCVVGCCDTRTTSRLWIIRYGGHWLLGCRCRGCCNLEQVSSYLHTPCLNIHHVKTQT
jgi:hypothetical protein